MRPECVVLPAPAVGQALRYRQRGKQLRIEELVPEPADARCQLRRRGAYLIVAKQAVERLCKTLLPR